MSDCAKFGRSLHAQKIGEWDISIDAGQQSRLTLLTPEYMNAPLSTGEKE